MSRTTVPPTLGFIDPLPYHLEEREFSPEFLEEVKNILSEIKDLPIVYVREYK